MNERIKGVKEYTKPDSAILCMYGHKPILVYKLGYYNTHYYYICIYIYDDAWGGGTGIYNQKKCLQ